MRIIIPSIQLFISAGMGFFLVQNANIDWQDIKDGLLFFCLLSIILYLLYSGMLGIMGYISKLFVGGHLTGYGCSPVLSISYLFILIILKPILVDISDIIYLIASLFLILLTDLAMDLLKNQSKNPVVKRSLVAILYLPTSTLLMVIIQVLLKPHLI